MTLLDDEQKYAEIFTDTERRGRIQWSSFRRRGTAQFCFMVSIIQTPDMGHREHNIQLGPGQIIGLAENGIAGWILDTYRPEIAFEEKYSYSAIPGVAVGDGGVYERRVVLMDAKLKPLQSSM